MNIPTEAQLMELADKLRAEQPGITPMSLLIELSKHVLAGAHPDRSAKILAGDYDRICQTFALEMLSLNGQPSTMWLGEDRQEKHYGGVEALMFGIRPDGLFEHYGRQLGKVDNPPVLDPELAAAEADLGG